MSSPSILKSNHIGTCFIPFFSRSCLRCRYLISNRSFSLEAKSLFPCSYAHKSGLSLESVGGSFDNRDLFKSFNVIACLVK